MTSFFNAHGTNPNIFSGQFQDLTFGSVHTDMFAERTRVSMDELIDTHEEPIFDPDELDIDIDMLDTLWSTPYLGSDYDEDDRHDDYDELPGIAVSLKGEVFFHEDYPLFGQSNFDKYAEIEIIGPVVSLFEDDFFWNLESDQCLDDWLGAEMHPDDYLSADQDFLDEEEPVEQLFTEIDQEEMQLMPSFSGTMVEHKRRKNFKFDFERARNHTMPRGWKRFAPAKRHGRESIRVIPIWMTPGYTAERFLSDHAALN